MITFIWNTLSFILALGILVTIHEYGHFWVARKLGFKVLKFSVGFGKPLWRRVGRDGVEYVVAAIPLGGYVKMLDAREGEVSESEKHQDFMQKPVLSRIAVVIAGPMANFLFAIAAFWLMVMLGVSEPRPFLGELPADGIAARAGLKERMEIIAIDGEETNSWRQVHLSLVDRIGETSALMMRSRDQKGVELDHRLDISNWEVDARRPDVLGSLGLKRFYPDIPVEIASVQKKSAAEVAGIQTGDTIVSVAGRSIERWRDLVEIIQENPDRTIDLVVRRDNKITNLSVKPETKTTKDGQKVGVLGVSPKPVPWPKHYVTEVNYGLIDGFFEACRRTWRILEVTVNGIKKLLTGLLSIETLSGPLSIAKGAGMSASYGLQAFLSFLAIVSVNLGLINLLPVPVLDGGHLMFYLYEWVRGKPVPQHVQEAGLRIGLALILTLMFLAIYYDILRLQN